MGKNILTYKGYSTRVEYSAEDNILHGKIEGIADLVNFESETIDGVEAAFHEAVDDYLAFCADIGQEPDKEYKGSFNVRIKPKLHRDLDRAAYNEGVSMNQFIETALDEYMESYNQKKNMGTYQSANNVIPINIFKDQWKDEYNGSGHKLQQSPSELYSITKSQLN